MSTNKKSNLTTGQKAWRLILCIIAPLVVGGVSALLTMDAMKQPPLSPPAILFPIAWTILYVLMGLASYFICMAGANGGKKEKELAKSALTIYGIQLVFNFFWSIIFFNLKWYWPALAWLVIMLILVIILTVKAKKLSNPAFFMLIPYVLWCIFATYLNIGIAILAS